MTYSKGMMFLSGFSFALGLWDLFEWGICPKTVTLLLVGLVQFLGGLHVD